MTSDETTDIGLNDATRAVISNTATAANILSSLQTEGVTDSGGEGKEGYVPIIGPDGKLDASLLPLELIETQLDIFPLENTVYVDPSNTREYEPTGSIARPFKSLQEASTAGRCNIILAAGQYSTATLNYQIQPSPSVIRLYCTGKTTIDTLTIDGYANDAVIYIDNLSVSNTLLLNAYCTSTLCVTGNSTLAKIQLPANFEEQIPEGGVSLKIAPESSLTTPNELVTTTFLACGSRIANNSLHVKGKTVEEAIDTLGTRKIRIPIFSATDAGLQVTEYQDISVPESDDPDLVEKYTLAALGTSLVTAINAKFHINGASPTYNTLQATSITTRTLNSTDIYANSITFKVEDENKAKIVVDEDNFLTILD